MGNKKGFLILLAFNVVVSILMVILFSSSYGVGKNQVFEETSPRNPTEVGDGLYDTSLRESASNVLPRRHAVVCMIFTTPSNWASKGRAVRLTWSTRCPFSIFFYSGSNVSEQHEIRQANNTVALDVPEGRDWLTGKTLAGLRYSLDKYGDVAEWFMKADDDTVFALLHNIRRYHDLVSLVEPQKVIMFSLPHHNYVIWENLEYLMEDYSKRSNSPPSYAGRIWYAHLPNGYTSGGAGYLISNRAAKLMIHEGPKKDGCPQSGGIEDIDIAKCLAEFGIYPDDARDRLGKLRFHANNPLGEMNNHNARADGTLSNLAITFHYVSPGEMLLFDYLLYHVRRGDRPPVAFSAFRPTTPSPLSSTPPTVVTNVTQKTTTNHKTK